MLCHLNVLITTQITQFFRMHDNTLVSHLPVLGWDITRAICFQNFNVDWYQYQNKKYHETCGFSWSQVRRQRLCCRVLCSLLRLALLRFSNLWANLDLESRQQLTHTHIHIHNAPICWGRGDLCLLCWQPCRSAAVEGEKVYGDVSGNCLGSSWGTFLITIIGTEPWANVLLVDSALFSVPSSRVWYVTVFKWINTN